MRAMQIAGTTIAAMGRSYWGNGTPLQERAVRAIETVGTTIAAMGRSYWGNGALQ